MTRKLCSRQREMPSFVCLAFIPTVSQRFCTRSSHSSSIKSHHIIHHLHRFSTIPAPCSSYSFLEIHIYSHSHTLAQSPEPKSLLPPYPLPPTPKLNKKPKETHLMKRPQARQNAPPNPPRILPLIHIPRRRNPNPRPGIQRLQFLIQALREALHQTRAPRHDYIPQEMRAHIHIHLI